MNRRRLLFWVLGICTALLLTFITAAWPSIAPWQVWHRVTVTSYVCSGHTVHAHKDSSGNSILIRINPPAWDECYVINTRDGKIYAQDATSFMGPLGFVKWPEGEFAQIVPGDIKNGWDPKLTISHKASETAVGFESACSGHVEVTYRL